MTTRAPSAARGGVQRRRMRAIEAVAPGSLRCPPVVSVRAPTSAHGRAPRAPTDAPTQPGDTTAMKLASLLAATLVAATLSGTALAQTFPTKPVRIVTPFPAGGRPRGGAAPAGREAAAQVGPAGDRREQARAPTASSPSTPSSAARTDGHDLIQLDNVHLVAYPHLFKKLPYDAAKDFDVIAPLFRTYFFVGVGADSKYKTVGDIIADAKAQSGQAELRLVVGRQPGAPGLGAARSVDRHRDAARHLQGDVDALYRRRQRRAELRARHAGHRGAAAARRQAQVHRRHRAAAPRRVPGRADGRANRAARPASR